MTKSKAPIAVVVLADTEGFVNYGRMAHALYLIRDAGDEAQLVLMGAGVKWGVFFADDEPHPFRDYFRPIFQDAQKRICGGSADKFDASAALRKAGYELEGASGDHISIHRLIVDGVSVVTF